MNGRDTVVTQSAANRRPTSILSAVHLTKCLQGYLEQTKQNSSGPSQLCIAVNVDVELEKNGCSSTATRNLVWRGRVNSYRRTHNLQICKELLTG